MKGIELPRSYKYEEAFGYKSLKRKKISFPRWVEKTYSVNIPETKHVWLEKNSLNIVHLLLFYE